jgi:hypothetical protein
MTTSTYSVTLGGPSPQAQASLAAALGQAPAVLASLEIIVAEASAFVPMELAAWTSRLTNAATVTIRAEDASVWTPVQTSLLLAGLQSQSQGQADGSRFVTAVKPMATATTGSAPIQLNLANDDDWIDEDNLLADASNLLAPPPSMSAASKSAADDCAGREPCADCSCGRASENAGPAAKPSAASSSCGKCSLGDAVSDICSCYSLSFLETTVAHTSATDRSTVSMCWLPLPRQASLQGGGGASGPGSAGRFVGRCK